MDTWYKLKIEAHGTNFDIIFGRICSGLHRPDSQIKHTGAISLVLDDGRRVRPGLMMYVLENGQHQNHRARLQKSKPGISPPYPPLNMTLNSQTNVSCNGRV